MQQLQRRRIRLFDRRADVAQSSLYPSPTIFLLFFLFSFPKTLEWLLASRLEDAYKRVARFFRNSLSLARAFTIYLKSEAKKKKRVREREEGGGRNTCTRRPDPRRASERYTWRESYTRYAGRVVHTLTRRARNPPNPKRTFSIAFLAF